VGLWGIRWVGLRTMFRDNRAAGMVDVKRTRLTGCDSVQGLAHLSFLTYAIAFARPETLRFRQLEAFLPDGQLRETGNAHRRPAPDVREVRSGHHRQLACLATWLAFHDRVENWVRCSRELVSGLARALAGTGHLLIELGRRVSA